MTDLTFAGYRAFDAPPDDPLRAKWLSMDRGTMRSYAVQPNMASVRELNQTINREIKFDNRESEEMSAWQTPQETLTRGAGDCKDYALLKYSLLMHKGLTARVVFGEIRKILANVHHAWCAALVDGSWYALDNMFDHLEPVATYANWTPKAAMHDDKVMRYGRAFTIAEQLREKSS
jgi:predicted transglutaminase-like cysteine proteinase